MGYSSGDIGAITLQLAVVYFYSGVSITGVRKVYTIDGYGK